MLSFIICDIDFFKQFNDHYGQIVGDQCLRQIAKVIDESAKRSRDVVGRYRGEEFVLIMPETGFSGLDCVIKTIQDGIRTLGIPHEKSKVSSHVTLSFGAVHTVPQAQTYYKDGLHSADIAIYEAKAQGRNRAIIKDVITPYHEGQS